MAWSPKPDPWEGVQGDLAARRLQPVYFFHGAEPWLVDRARIQATEAARPSGPRGFNRDDFQGSEASADQVLAAARTVPMMAPHRLVVVRDAPSLKGDPKGLLEWIRKPRGEAHILSTVLVLTAGKLGKEGLGPQLQRAVGKEGVCVEFRPLFDKSILPWVRGEATRQGKRLSDEGARFLVDMCGTHLASLSGEITKASLYVGERPELRLEDLEEVVADLRMTTVFDLTEALATRDLAGAVLAIDRAFEKDRDPSLPILAMVARHYRQLLGIREELESGTDEKLACAKNGANPGLAWKIAPQARKARPEDLRRALRWTVGVEQSLKISRLEGRLALERLAIRICQGG